MACVALGSSGHFLWPIAFTLSLKWFWLNNNLGGVSGGCNLVWGGDRIKNTVFLVTQHGGRGGQEESGDPVSHFGHSRP